MLLLAFSKCKHVHWSGIVWPDNILPLFLCLILIPVIPIVLFEGVTCSNKWFWSSRTMLAVHARYFLMIQIRLLMILVWGNILDVTWIAIVMCFSATTCFKGLPSLSASFYIDPLLCLADKMFPCWLITINTVFLETPTKVAASVTETPDIQSCIIVSPSKSESSALTDFYTTIYYSSNFYYWP